MDHAHAPELDGGNRRLRYGHRGRIRAAALAATVVVLASVAAACSSGSGSGRASKQVTDDPATTAGAPSPSTTAGQGQADAWPTYGHDVRRTGVAASGPDPAHVRQQWASPDLDGLLYAQPLVVGNRVIAATEGNSVYALDIATGAQVWRFNAGTPMRRADLPCGNIDPSGITGTPAVDTSTGTVYAVAFIQPGRFDLVALDLASGALKFRRSVTPPGDDPKAQQERGALTIANGRVYVPFGGLFGDCGQYHGWVISSALDGSGDLQRFQVPTQREGAIWSPGGPVADDQGNLFVATGNAESVSSFDHGNSVIRLSPALALSDFFAPSDFAARSRADADLGSIGPVLVDGGLVFQSGKVGDGFLLRASDLGRIGGQAFTGQVCSSAFGTAAFRSPVIYVPCTDGLVALRLSVSPASFSVAWRGPSVVAGPPLVAGNAVWWLAIGSGELVASAASDGHELARLRVGDLPSRFTSPSAAGGRLFVPAGRHVLSFSS